MVQMGLWWWQCIYSVCLYACVRVCVVTILRTLRPIWRSYRCYLTEPTQTLFSSFPSSSLLFCLSPWQTRGPGGPWPNRWETHSRHFSLLLLHVACICCRLSVLSKLKSLFFHCSRHWGVFFCVCVCVCGRSTSSACAGWRIIDRFIVSLCREKANQTFESFLTAFIVTCSWRAAQYKDERSNFNDIFKKNTNIKKDI